MNNKRTSHKLLLLRGAKINSKACLGWQSVQIFSDARSLKGLLAGLGTQRAVGEVPMNGVRVSRSFTILVHFNSHSHSWLVR